jgi:Ca-activated chloride channel homolog
MKSRKRHVVNRMRRPLLVFLLLAAALAAPAQTPAAAQADILAIDATPLGDTEEGIVTRLTFRLTLGQNVPQNVPVVLQGSISRERAVLRNFRHELPPGRHDLFTMVQTLPAGEIEIEARVLVPLRADAAPMLLGKSVKTLTVAPTNTAYQAAESDGAEGIIAEGVVPETTGAVKILPPRRDLAPHLFIVNVEVQKPVTRVEFWVDTKKILTRNAPPYRAELDLGAIPKRVEVRAIGYDKAGRYIDADAFVVNERETQLEVKITRTQTPEGVSHFKLSVQNPKNLPIRSVVLFAGDRKLFEWTRPPYAVSIANAQLQGVEFVRAAVTDETNFEAADLLFLDGQRFTEEIEVNLVELPVSVTDASGAPVTDLKQADFRVLEEKKAMKISSFAFSNDLPISVGVIVDHSGSMKTRIETARNAAIDFFQQIITPRDRAFFGAFAWDPGSISPFVSDIPSLRAQVRDMPEAEGATALYDAIVSGLYRFRGVAGRKALILVTDGEDTASRVSYDDMLKYARASRVPLYFIGVAMSAMDFSATNKMKALAAETGGSAYFVKDADALKDVYKRLENELRTQYLISYYAESTKKDDRYRTVEVQTTRPGVKVRTIRGYIP